MSFSPAILGTLVGISESYFLCVWKLEFIGGHSVYLRTCNCEYFGNFVTVLLHFQELKLGIIFQSIFKKCLPTVNYFLWSLTLSQVFDPTFWQFFRETEKTQSDMKNLWCTKKCTSKFQAINGNLRCVCSSLSCDNLEYTHTQRSCNIWTKYYQD